MVAYFLEIRARTNSSRPFFILETGLKFLIWTRSEIGPGNRAGQPGSCEEAHNIAFYITDATLVFPNYETAAMLVFQTNPSSWMTQSLYEFWRHLFKKQASGTWGTGHYSSPGGGGIGGGRINGFLGEQKGGSLKTLEGFRGGTTQILHG